MYAAQPAFSEVQLSLLEDDVVELELKSPRALRGLVAEGFKPS